MLNEGLDNPYRLTLVCAPAGFGKTTLLSSWLIAVKSAKIQPDFCITWLSLDKRDDDPLVFWSYIAASLQLQLEGMGGQTLGLLKNTPTPELEIYITLLVNDLALISKPIILVLDDYQVIRNQIIHQSLSQFINCMPPNFHLTVASRTDPPLSLALLRGRGQLIEIRSNDLRLSNEDAIAFLNSGMGLHLSADAAETLNEKAEGWIAGLQMAAISLRDAAASEDREKVNRLVASFSGGSRFILDYFMEEVLNQQPPGVQSFLVRTSILDNLCAPLCDTILTGIKGGASPGSQKILEYLESGNLFLSPLDDGRYWYRYHQLFADLLRKRLLQLDPDSIPKLHQRASRWFEEQHMTTYAFDHAIAAGDQVSAGLLVDANINSVWSDGEIRTMIHWLDTLNEEQLNLRPELKITKVLLLANEGNIMEADSLNESVERMLVERENISAADEGAPSFGIDREELALLHVLVYVAHAWVASLRQDSQTTLKYALPALESVKLLEDPRYLPWLCHLYMAISTAYIQQGDQESAILYLSKTIELGKSSDNYYFVLTALTKKATALWLQGHINQAARTCQEGLDFIEKRHLKQFPVIDSLLITWGFILCERGKLDEAESYIRDGLELSQIASHIFIQAWAYQEMIRLMIAKNDINAAEEYIQCFLALAEEHEIPQKFVNGTACLKSIVLISRGSLAEAERELQRHGVVPSGEISVSKLFFYLCLARLLLAKRDLAGTKNLLDRLSTLCQSKEQVPYLITAYKIRTLLSVAQGDMSLAVDTFETALGLAEPEGYFQTFIDEGKPMARVLDEYVHRNGGTDFTRKLSIAFKQKAISHPTAFAGIEWVEPLSEREREVLGLLGVGMSNQEIASRLFLSLRTIKFHTSNIYDKLGVKNRTEAVSQARKLKLLS